MSKQNTDIKELCIRFRLDENDKVHFINSSVDCIPLELFCNVLSKAAEAEKEWNNHIDSMKQNGN